MLNNVWVSRIAGFILYLLAVTIIIIALVYRFLRCVVMYFNEKLGSRIMNYSLADIKEAFINYYTSPRTVNLYEDLTEDEDREIEWNDFVNFLNKPRKLDS